MEKATSSDGTTIAYDKTGDGPPTAIVDGAFVYRVIDQLPVQLAEILARYTVAHYERRSRGNSGDTPPYPVEREIEDLQAVIDAVGGSAYVLGLSSGCRAGSRGGGPQRLRTVTSSGKTGRGRWPRACPPGSTARWRGRATRWPRMPSPR